VRARQEAQEGEPTFLELPLAQDPHGPRPRRLHLLCACVQRGRARSDPGEEELQALRSSTGSRQRKSDGRTTSPVGKNMEVRAAAPDESGSAAARRAFPGGSNSVSLVLRALGCSTGFLRRRKPETVRFTSIWLVRRHPE